MFNSSPGEGEFSIRFDLAFFTCRVLLQLRFSTKNEKKNENFENFEKKNKKLQWKSYEKAQKNEKSWKSCAKI